MDKSSYAVELIYSDHTETVTDVTQVDHAFDTLILWRNGGSPVSVRIPENIRVFGVKVEQVETK